MKYKTSWRGHLRVDDRGNVYWDHRYMGFLRAKLVTGARSPGGMLTNQVWETGDGKEFASKSAALCHLIDKHLYANPTANPKGGGLSACGATHCPGCVNCGRGLSNR